MKRKRRAAPIGGVIPLPDEFVDWVVAAVEAGLSCPVGRALYVANRKRHTWPGRIKPWDGVTVRSNGEPMRVHYTPTELQLMETMRARTAEQWLDHWLCGGSIDSKSEMSDVQTILRMQRNADKSLDEGQRLRRGMRRARRGTLVVLHDNSNDDDTTGPSAHFEERTA